MAFAASETLSAAQQRFGQTASVPDSNSVRVFDAVDELTLPKSEWTHQAHLVVCWVALSTRGPDETIDFLRTAIRRYNEATGVENTPTSGYHETLTRYYVGAVHSTRAETIEDVIAAPQCDVDAPARHWTRDRLFSLQARAAWVDPDVLNVPWIAHT